jgi:hypothetical protein
VTTTDIDAAARDIGAVIRDQIASPPGKLRRTAARQLLSTEIAV